MLPQYLIVLLLAAAVSCRTASTNQNKIEEARSDDSIGDNLMVAYNTYRECNGGELSSCLKQKLAKTLTRLSKADELSLLSGVTMVRDKSVPVKDENVEEALPRGVEDLDNLIFDKIVGFLQTHTIQVNNINYDYYSMSLTHA